MGGPDSQRRSARLLATMLATIIGIGAVSAGVQLALVPGFLPTAATIAAALGLLAFAWLLNHQGRYWPAAILTAWTITTGAMVAAAANPGDVMSLAFPSLGVLVAGVLLSMRDTALLALASLAAMIALGAASAELRASDLMAGLSFQVMTSALVLGTARHRALVEADHLTEQHRRHEMALRADRLASIGLLATSVAHEISNPLTAVAADVAVLKRRVGRDGSSELAHLLADTEDGIDRIAAITRSLLTFARGDHEAAPAAVDVRRSMEAAIGLVAMRIRHRARLVEHYGDVPAARGLAGPLEQVFVNLLLNAAQAIPEGDADQHQIAVRVGLDDDGRIEIAVDDTGTGIAADALDRIFEPFFTTKPAGEGTGLGLTICRNIITSFGGEIRCDSRVGAGTRFRVALPPATPAPAARA